MADGDARAELLKLPVRISTELLQDRSTAGADDTEPELRTSDIFA